jgi:hypothetical protein
MQVTVSSWPSSDLQRLGRESMNRLAGQCGRVQIGSFNSPMAVAEVESPYLDRLVGGTGDENVSIVRHI